MKKKTSSLFLIPLVMLLAACSLGCSQSNDFPKASEDEIKLIIQLDLKEDIGLLVLDNMLDGIETSGGISNADKSMLRRDDVLDWTFSRQEYGSLEVAADLSVRFRVITEYFDPNYENNYPEEYTVLLDPLSFEVECGHTYHVTITGDKEGGYQAALDESTVG